MAMAELESLLDDFGRGTGCVDESRVERTERLLRRFEERMQRLHARAETPRPIVLASYGAWRAQPGLDALVALLLRRYGVPVVVHGVGVAADGVTTLAVLRHLGIAPAMDHAHVQTQLARDGLAYVGIEALAPELGREISGAKSSERGALLRALASLIDPFGGDGYRVIGTRRGELNWLRAVLGATRADALLIVRAQADPSADLTAPPELESFVAGVRSVSVVDAHAARSESTR